MRIENPERIAFPSQSFGESNQRRLPQIIGAWLERDPERGHCSPPLIRDQPKSPIDMGLVASKYTFQQWQAHIAAGTEMDKRPRAAGCDRPSVLHGRLCNT